jgi:hypothetical protein
VRPLYHQAIELIDKQLQKAYDNCTNYQPHISVELPQELNVYDIILKVEKHYQGLGYSVDHNGITITIGWHY